MKENNEEYLFEQTGDTSHWTPIRNTEKSDECEQLARPRYSVALTLVDLLIPWAILVVVADKCLRLAFSDVWLPLTVLYLVLRLKQILLWLILLYQKYGAWNLREACLFTPTCSQYMFLSIQKYGVITGIAKGIRRLLRCKPPNGGEDYP